MLANSYGSGAGGFIQSQLTPSEILGISAYRKNSEKRLLAATDPKRYLENRINEEKAIEKDIAQTYDGAVIAYGSIKSDGAADDKIVSLEKVRERNTFDYKYSMAEVQELALIKAKGVRDALLAKLESDYPVEYNKTAAHEASRQQDLTLAAKGGYRPSEGRKKGGRRKRRGGKRK